MRSNKAQKKKERQEKKKPESSDDESEDERRTKKREMKVEDRKNSLIAHKKNIIAKASAVAFVRNFWNGAVPEAIASDSLKQERKSLGIQVKGALSLCPPPATTISTAGLPNEFESIFKYKSLTTPSVIQMQCWPAALCGANILGIAPTGSGKTYAYGLPMIPHISTQLSSLPPTKIIAPIGLVIVPTRELATQVVAALKKPFEKVSKLRCAAIFGGQNKEDQLDGLIGSGLGYLHVAVCTPGRLLDLISSKFITLTRVTYFVLDEADRMLALGFADQLTAIASQIRPDRQTLLFSATFPGRLRTAADSWICGGEESSVTIRCNALDFSDNKPNPNNKDSTTKEQGTMVPDVLGLSSSAGKVTDDVNAESSDAVAPAIRSVSTLTISKNIVQDVHVCAAHKKPRLLLKYILARRKQEADDKVRQPGSMLIFCTKIKTLKFVVDFLKRQGKEVGVLHGQLHQDVRQKTLDDFKAGKLNMMCATDVAARGIHIKNLKYVINYDFPSNLEQYCHRVGRTGRANASKAPSKDGAPVVEGYSYSFFTRNLNILASDLITLLQSCDQVVEPNLQLISRMEIAGEDHDPTEEDEDLGDMGEGEE